MGRTIPSFRLAGMAEELKWRSYRYNLGKKDRKIFDEMFSLSRLYNSASSNCVRPVIIHCVVMSIIFHHYKQLMRLTKKNKEVINR